MSRNIAKCAIFLCLAVLALPDFARAQSDRGTITGTVADPAGAVVPAAVVVLRNSETGALSQTVTTSTGNFTLPSLPVGTYELSVEAPGFRKSVQQGIRVQVAQTLRLDIVLQVGAASESVTITAEVPLLKTENAEQSINVSGDRINSLPLNFGGGGGNMGAIRNPLSFVILSPGVSGSGSTARVNGLPNRSLKILVEGQDVTSGNDTGWTSNVSHASVEMLEEFSLQTSNFAAEFGQVGGGLFNFTTRSGTNQFHGSAYEYMTHEALDAHRPFTHARPESRKHNFGATIGGPVWIPKVYNGRDRTFFFFNFEAFRNRINSAGSFATVPTEAFRNGDFSAALTGRQLGTDPLGRPIMENTIYDPLTTRSVNGQIVRDPFPGNRIPTSRFDPVAARIQALIPLPQNGNLINNWSHAAPNSRVQTIPAIQDRPQPRRL